MITNSYYILIDISSIVVLGREKWKSFTLQGFLGNRFSSILFTIESRKITQEPNGKRDILLVSFGQFLSTFLSWRLSHCFVFLLFMLFSKDGDKQPALWRYSLWFSYLMVFSWSSVFLFERLWLTITNLDQWNW